MQEFSAKSLILIPDSKDALEHIRSLAPTFIISTSYEHYIRALCKVIGFPYENTFCTKVSLDKYELSQSEKRRLIELAGEISEMPVIDIPKNATRLDDLPKEHQKTVRRLDEIFWKEIANMPIGKIFDEVNPIGGREKADALKQICSRLGISLDGLMYVGDSITDVEALSLVKTGGGLAVAFNGNRYAVRNADIAILSETGLTTAVVAELFLRYGRDAALDAVNEWSEETLRKRGISEALLRRLFATDRKAKVTVVKTDNVELLIEESEAFRKMVRGEAVGGLG
ncbi:HAD hydrolase family protein [Candidatus Bathyarchaeota archaeon]|nr:HAD hydrolase family protein [Candidatus Bathyarchaeota archaeon]